MADGDFIACLSLCEEFVTVSAEILFGSQQAIFTSAWFSYSFFSLFHVIWTLLAGGKLTWRVIMPPAIVRQQTLYRVIPNDEDRPKTLRLGSNVRCVIQGSKVLVIL